MRIGIAQTDGALLVGEPRQAVLEQVLQEAAQNGTELVVFPELFQSGYNVGTSVVTSSEPQDGPFFAKVAALCRHYGVAAFYGYVERFGDNVYNSAQLVGDTGASIANYRKRMLPPGFEPDYFTAGTKSTIIDYKGIKFGLLICYDVEFPESVRALAQAGVQCVLVPTALGDQWGVVAYAVVPSRAFENGVYVVYANHCGVENGLSYLGQSCIVAPQGDVLARAGNKSEFIQADIVSTQVTAAQDRLPYLQVLNALNR